MNVKKWISDYMNSVNFACFLKNIKTSSHLWNSSCFQLWTNLNKLTSTRGGVRGGGKGQVGTDAVFLFWAESLRSSASGPRSGHFFLCFWSEKRACFFRRVCWAQVAVLKDDVCGGKIFFMSLQECSHLPRPLPCHWEPCRAPFLSSPWT